MLKGEMPSTVTAEERFRQLYDRHAGPILMYLERRTDTETPQDSTAATFVASGEDVPNTVLWFSPDGYSWERTFDDDLEIEHRDPVVHRPAQRRIAQ